MRANERLNFATTGAWAWMHAAGVNMSGAHPRRRQPRRACGYRCGTKCGPAWSRVRLPPRWRHPERLRPPRCMGNVAEVCTYFGSVAGSPWRRCPDGPRPQGLGPRARNHTNSVFHKSIPDAFRGPDSCNTSEAKPIGASVRSWASIRSEWRFSTSIAGPAVRVAQGGALQAGRPKPDSFTSSRDAFVYTCIVHAM